MNHIPNDIPNDTVVKSGASSPPGITTPLATCHYA